MSKLDNGNVFKKEKKNKLLPEIFPTDLKNIRFLFPLNILDYRTMIINENKSKFEIYRKIELSITLHFVMKT